MKGDQRRRSERMAGSLAFALGLAVTHAEYIISI